MPVALQLPTWVNTHEPSVILDAKKAPFSWSRGKEGKSYYEALLDFPADLGISLKYQRLTQS